MDLTYQQLLAETFEENAKNMLIHQTEYEDEEQPPYEKYDYDENELEDQEEFQKFHGDRNKPEHVIKPKSDTGGKSDLNHKTNVRTIVLNIDGAFRGNIVPNTDENCNLTPSESNLGSTSSPSNQLLSSVTTHLQLATPIVLNGASSGTLSSYFAFNASQLYKNITSVKLTSLEFYNSFYTFSFIRGNTYFYITLQDNSQYTIVIPDGNYPTYPQFASALQTACLKPYTFLFPLTSPNDLISAVYSIPTNIAVSYDVVGHNIVLSGDEFTLQFPPCQTNPYTNGIGYNMGFLNNTYTVTKQLGNTLAVLGSDQSPDIVQDTYIYLQINDWNLVEHQQYGQTHFSVFAKIPLNSPKNTVIFDNNYLNSTTKEYVFQQPVNLQKFTIKMIDVYGNVLDLRGGNFSMTIELQQVNNSAVYEKLLEL